MRDWSDYIDNYGLPIGVYFTINDIVYNKDVEDSMNRIALINTYLCNKDENNESKSSLFKAGFVQIGFKLYEYKRSGLLLRHPNSAYGTNDVSRDQEKSFIQSVILTMIHNKDLNVPAQEFMKRYIDSKRGKRFWNWYQNKDIAGPAVFADLIRPFPNAPMWKIYLGDIDNFISAMIQIIISWYDHDNVDRSVNMYNNMEYARLTRETFISKITAFLFKKLVYGGVKYQLYHYFRVQIPGSAYSTSPPINELVSPILEAYYS